MPRTKVSVNRILAVTLGLAAIGVVWAAGAVLVQVTGWIFLRRVSIGRAIGETAVGMFSGMIGGAFIAPGRPVYLLGLIGFLFAAARLWILTRPVDQQQALDAEYAERAE